METEASKHITVLIAGRPYPLKVKPNDEPVIRKLVKEINEKVNKFHLSYNQKDKQDCLAMTLLTYAVDLQKGGAAEPVDLSPVENKIQDLEVLLDKGLT